MARTEPMKPKLETRLMRALTILTGALMLLWPAFYNRYPLLFPDSVSYLADGRGIARALFLHQFQTTYGMRSLVYSLSLLPLHLHITAWPIVFANALTTAWILWLVTRSFFPQRTITSFLALIAILAAFTPASWYASLIMPDILGPTLYLAMYLFVFAYETLSSRERIALAVIATWATASHVTHLMLALILCIPLLALLLVPAARAHMRLRGLATIAAIFFFAIAAQIGLNAFLYHQPTLDARRPPYLMARILGDGPGRWYLQKNCTHLSWAICDSVANLPDNDDKFLWDPDGIWPNASDEKQAQLRREEMPFVLASIRAYPRAQFDRSLDNAWQQLTNYDVHDFDANTWMDTAIGQTLPADGPRYAHSRQSQSAMPEDAFSNLHTWTVDISLVTIAILLPIACRRRQSNVLSPWPSSQSRSS